MKLLFSSILIWTLTSTASALQCISCTNKDCSATTPLQCNTETMCIAANIQATSSGTSATQPYQACALPSLCPSIGSQTFSVDLGVAGALASALCCNSDNCNSQIPPAPSAQSANGLLCTVCNPSTKACSSLPCAGVETNCFSATLTSGPVLGCISPNTCSAAQSLGSLPFMQSVGNITSGPACCSTSLCNSPQTTTATTTSTTPPTTTTTTPTTTTTTPTTTTTTPTTTTTTPTTTTTTPTTTTTTPTTTTTTPTTTTTTTTPTTTTTTPTTTTTTPTTTTTTPTTTTTTPTTTTTTSSTTATTTTTTPTTTPTQPITATTTTTQPITATTTTTQPITATTTTTAAASATATPATTKTTQSDASSLRVGILPLLLGLFIFMF